jgi:hypothetical protein
MKLDIDVEHLLTHGTGYWYLSTPFAHFPGGHDLAFEQACKIRGKLLLRGISCFSPITETYMVAKVCGQGAALVIDQAAGTKLRYSDEAGPL